MAEKLVVARALHQSVCLSANGRR